MSSRRRRVSVVLTTAILGTALVAVTPPAQAALPGTSISGTYTNTYGSRSYIGYVPSTYRQGTAVPLVVALHGCNETNDQFRQLTRFDASAESNGYIVVFPQQSYAANASGCWNWFVSSNYYRGQGEPSLIAGITTRISGSYTIDPKRIFVVGVSAGGAMANIMGATYPDLYAAVGSGSGCEYQGYPCGATGGPNPVTQGQKAYQAEGAYARVVPVLSFQGDADTAVAPLNGQQVIDQWISADDYADDGSHNGSIPTSVASTQNGQVSGGESYTISHYVDGHGASLADYWLVHGMGHAWGGGCSCQLFADPSGPDETGAFWSFFSAHPKP